MDKICAQDGSYELALKPVRHICLTSCTLVLSSMCLFPVGPSEMRAAYYYDGASSPYGVSASISALVDKSCAERGSERSAPKPVRQICLTSCTLDLSNVRFFVPVGPSAMRVAYY